MKSHPRFITLEGSEGVGKSTLINRLAQWLRDQGQSVVLTREPGGTPLAEQIRELVLSQAMCSDTELLLLFAARSQHIHEVIAPALESGWVLCDRYVDASYAYQGFGREVKLEQIDELSKSFVSVMPALTLWLDAPVQVGLQRAAERSAPDRFEQEKLEFFNQIRRGYQYQQAHSGGRIQRIDAEQSADQVFSEAVKLIQSVIKLA